MLDSRQQETTRLTTGKTIIKNFLSLALGNVVSKLLIFLSFVAIARVLGPAYFGKINFAQAIMLYFLIITHLGLSLFGTREIAHNRIAVKQYVNEIVSLRIILTIISIAAMTAVSFLVTSQTDTRTLIILFGLSLLPTALYFDWVFKGLESMEFIGITEVIRATVLFLLLKFFIRTQGNLLLIPVFFVISATIATSLLYIIYARRINRFRFTFDISRGKQLLKTALPLGLSLIMIQVYYQLGTVVLGLLKGDTAVGWFNAAYKVVLFIIGFASLFVDAIFPVISRYHKRSQSDLSRFSNIITKIAITFAMPLAILTTIYAPKIVNVLYGDQYMQCVIILQIMIWTTAVIVVSMTFGNSLIACNGERQYFKGVAIGAIINVVLTLVLTQTMGYVGTSIAMLVTEISVITYMIFKYMKIVRIYIERYVLKAGIAAFPMTIVALLSRNNLGVSIAVSLTVYALSFVAIRGISRADIQLAKHYFREK